MLKLFFGNFNFKTTSLLKSGLIFDQAAKLGKASRGACNTGLWLILWALLKNGVAGGVASNSYDTKLLTFAAFGPNFSYTHFKFRS